MELTANELKDLVVALSQSSLAELTLKSSTFELTLRKQAAPSVSSPFPPAVEVAIAPTVAAPPSPPVEVIPLTPASPPAAPPGKGPELTPITSPMVGTFYRSPAPDEPPFVETGDRIRSGQTVCIIEAMKLMNELEAEVAGEVVEILVNNGEPIEFGQTLMLVRPS
ncbi:MAG: acetyl-CoA carboxylase biotin carboxyl carrier protein [Nodosilinea sp.]